MLITDMIPAVALSRPVDADGKDTLAVRSSMVRSVSRYARMDGGSPNASEMKSVRWRSGPSRLGSPSAKSRPYGQKLLRAIVGM
jgi:hypothetical protein